MELSIRSRRLVVGSLAILAMTLSIVLPGCADAKANSQSRSASISAVRLVPFTLRNVAPCFYRGPDGAQSWPVPPYPSTVERKSTAGRLIALSQPSAIRGSFNEPRGEVHFGIDVETRDRGPVYAMRSGPVLGLKLTRLSIGNSTALLSYWHVAPLRSLRVGQQVERGQLIGHVLAGYWHVHVSEWYEPCGGWVDPRRPAGPLHDPDDNSAPTIGTLTARAVDSLAFAPQSAVDLKALLTPDRARPMDLAHLSGIVDLRADVSVMPSGRMKTFPQMPFAPAALRAYLTPLANRHASIGPVFTYNGVRLVKSDGGLWHLWAHGTYRSNSCYFHPGDPSRPCGFRISYHVGGPQGLDTRRVPNGDYEYCIEALGDSNASTRRCTIVTISN